MTKKHIYNRIFRTCINSTMQIMFRGHCAHDRRIILRDGCTYLHVHVYILCQCRTVYVGLAQARPNNDIMFVC